jgi:uncharacterized membrane protein
MADGTPKSPTEVLINRIADIEQRLSRIEERTGLAPVRGANQESPPDLSKKSDEATIDVGRTQKSGDEFEFEVGQSWFAKVGIIVLAIGMAVTLTRPFPGLPPAFPSLIGFAIVGVLSFVAWLGRSSFEMLAAYLRRAAMALSAFSAFRLFFFGSTPVFSTDSTVGRLLLLVVLGINLAIAIRRKSPYLATLCILMGLTIAVVIPSEWFSVSVIAATCLGAAILTVRYRWTALLPITVPLCYASYLIWVFLNPPPGSESGTIRDPGGAIYFVLAYALILAWGTLFRRDRGSEDAVTILSSILNCTGGYLTFLLHSLAATTPVFVTSNLVAAIIFLGVAVAFWVREKSQVSTFLYAMTGYMAVTAALVRAFSQPELFIWLSLQSVLVVVTAAWFRSRFIVVANFLIFLVIVASYIASTTEESGIILVFGLVALVTARLLNWKTTYLELKSESMRNAYLLTAFGLFPYGLYHMVPQVYVSLSWVGMALLYYLLSYLLRNRKYRWMGHGTLLLSALYLVVVGVSRLEPTYRSISLFVLGAVLLSVSVIFTMVRARQKAMSGPTRENKDDIATPVEKDGDESGK